MNSRGFLCSLALLWAAATTARRCERRRPAAPHTFLKGGSTPSEERPSYQSKKCGDKLQGRVIGGYPVAPYDSPWTVALFLDDFVRTRCGGSLVTYRHVVTAAHCVVNTTVETVYQPSQFLVLVGAKDLRNRDENSSELIGVASVWPHEGLLNGNFKVNDIAVLVLARPATPGLSAAPVCLPYPLLGWDLAGRESIVVGWGMTASGVLRSDVLMAANLTIVSEENCRKAYRVFHWYNESHDDTRVQICATSGNGGRDACGGDSGGPLVTEGPDARMFLVGVVSSGRGCASPKYPGIYSRVTEYLDWIDARLRGRPPPGPKARTEGRLKGLRPPVALEIPRQRGRGQGRRGWDRGVPT